MAVVLFRLAENVWASRGWLVDSLVCIAIAWLTGLLELLNLLKAAESVWAMELAGRLIGLHCCCGISNSTLNPKNHKP